MLLTVIIEAAIFIIGLIIYSKVTHPLNKTGKYGLIILAALLIIIYILNFIGPPPPDTASIAWIGQLQWLFVLFAFWIDKN
jgi:hypothetical protein